MMCCSYMPLGADINTSHMGEFSVKRQYAYHYCSQEAKLDNQ